MTYTSLSQTNATVDPSLDILASNSAGAFYYFKIPIKIGESLMESSTELYFYVWPWLVDCEYNLGIVVVIVTFTSTVRTGLIKVYCMH